MRFATYNIEWMNGLFEQSELRLDDRPSSRENASRAEQAQAISQVLRHIDADVYLILEAPNNYDEGATKRALENFAKHFDLRQNRALHGHSSGTDQEIALLFDPKRIEARFEAFKHSDAPAFDDEFEIDLPGAKSDEYRFSKPPLEAQIVDLDQQFAFRLIGAHIKTKAPHGANNDREAQKISFSNRRKQIAQASWIRKRIDHMHFPFIVAGDFNDGPGFDEYETVLGMSSIDILVGGGKLFDPALRAPQTTTTARFYNREDQSYKEALLDFVLVSQEMQPFAKKWRIWHPLHDAQIGADAQLSEALMRASDHFPVSLDLVFGEAQA